MPAARELLPDGRLTVVHDSAANVQAVLAVIGLPPADTIVSGIPLGSMPEPVRAEIAARSRAALRPGGAFLVYQFTARTLPALRRAFGDVERRIELRNLPPAQVFVCTRGGA